jgi:ankyrin repeat protein
MLPLLLLLQQSAVNESFYEPIRNGDMTALMRLLKEHGAKSIDSRRQTPLMLASAFGSFEAVQAIVYAGADVKAANAAGLTALHLAVGDARKVKLLLDRGADVHARSAMGRTPLLVAAYTTGSAESVKLLLSRGSDLATADATGITPLLAAVAVDDESTVRMLLDAGASVQIRANIPGNATPLLAAAHNGNVDLTRLLLAKNASASAVSEPNSAKVLNGTIAFGAVTALHSSVIGGSPEIVRMLLNAGAPVDAQDVRGMTPLIWAVSTDRPNVAIIRMLLEKGSSPLIRSREGESSLDWARKFNDPAVLAALKLEPASTHHQPSAPSSGAATPRAAVERALPLLEKTAGDMLSRGGCVACHAQPVAQVAARLASSRGWNVSGEALNSSLQKLSSQWLTADQPLLQGNEPGGTPDGQLYSTFALADGRVASSWNTDVLVYYLLSKQRQQGYWKGIGATRAPIQDGNISRTALAVRALAVYAIPARRAEIEDRIKRAGDWLAAQQPVTTEDRVMQLLGMKWANVASRSRETRLRELIALQQADGGFAQTAHLRSDAYATGQVLYTLRELEASAAGPAINRAVNFLVQTQREDGSWFVPSRAMKIQPYFESGFPYGHDQWISAAGTAWAVMGLAGS